MGLVGIISDAHGNIHAFRKVLECLDRIGVEQYLFLGDAIGYIPTCAVLEEILLRSSQFICVRGNHEQMLLDGNVHTPNENIYQMQHVASQISAETFSMIDGWKSQATLQLAGLRILMQHGSPQDPLWGYVYPDTELRSQVQFADLVLMGNTHLPFLKQEGDTYWLNPGSCGLPRDDGRFASAAVMSTDPLHIEILRVNITEETTRVLLEHPTVHDSTKSVFKRRSQNLVGRVLE